MEEHPLYIQVADRHFEEARRQADREQLTAWISGQKDGLLPFDEIRDELKSKHPLSCGVHEIPIDQIAGSLGRYTAFTRHFLPLSDELRERWIKLESLAQTRGWPPIEVYEVGNIYFVKDGNHRVAVARQMGAETIRAHIWRFPTEVELDPEDSLSAVLLRLGEQNFIEQTSLDKLRPNHDICLTVPGFYTELLAQIHNLQKKYSVVDSCQFCLKEAVEEWYEMIYMPAVKIIRETGLLEAFPGRTATDLFAWISTNRRQLEELYGDQSLAEWAAALAQDHREGPVKKTVRRIGRLFGRDEPALLEDL